MYNVLWLQFHLGLMLAGSIFIYLCKYSKNMGSNLKQAQRDISIKAFQLVGGQMPGEPTCLVLVHSPALQVSFL